jgi:Carbohydrate family 9 binding domain-like/Domain of unknown function (DUF5916)
MQRRWRLCLLLFVFLLNTVPLVFALAQNANDPHVKRPLLAVKTPTPPTIDGDLSDTAWAAAPKADGFVDRQNGTGVPDQTIASLLYDEKFLYIAFRCRDSQPEKIVARETVRDQKFQRGDSGDNEDNVEVDFDPFLTHRSDDFARFSVNPLGTKSARISGGRGGKAEWKGDWDAVVKRVADGWVVEMRIPWGILSYPNGKKAVTMGLNFTRWQDRTKTLSIWSNTGPQNFQENEGLWNDVAVPLSAFHPRLSVLPYILPNTQGLRPGFRSGLDARYPFTPELTGVASLNPDFGTIEGAVEGIAFSRSERFVPERRPFFLEGNDYFQAGQDFSVGRYFYSNRIPIFSVGTKFFGKVTSSDTVGVLNAESFGNRNDLVARYRHDLSPTSNVGLFLMQKSAFDDNNSVGVLVQDARRGKFGVASELALSSGRDAGGDAKEVNLTYGDKFIFTSVQLLDVSPRFRDADGLIGFTDYRGAATFQDWGAQWRKGFWRAFDVGVFTQLDWHRDGRPFRRGGNVFVYLEARRDWSVSLNVNADKFDAQTDKTVGFSFTNGVSNRFRQWGFHVETGIQGDRPSTFVGPQFSFRILRKLDLIYSGAVQNLDGLERQHILTANYEVSPTRSIGGRLVIHNSAMNAYLSLRRSGEKGTEVYFIIGDPNAERFRKQVAMKVVFAL